MAQVDYASTSGMENYYNLREPDFTYTKAGILEKIKYSTGGSKEIRYEPNKYNRIIKRNTGTGALSIQSCPEKVGGGLRVKEMIENDGTNSYSKRYIYSPGILNGEIQYYWSNYRGKLLNGNTYTADRFFTNSMLPVSSNLEGGSVSYTGVTEQNVGNGRTEYVFSNHDNTIDDNSVSIDLQKSPYSPLSGKVVERGKLLETKIYKEGASAPFSKETYQYSVQGNNREYVRAVYLRRLALFNTYEINAIEGSACKIYIYNYNITKRTDTVYYSNSQNPLTTQTTYGYNSYNQVTKTEFTDSDGSIWKQEMKYPIDFQTSPYPDMVTKNILTPVVETSVYKNTSLIEKTGSDYALQADTFYAPVNMKYRKGTGSMDVRETYLYDRYGNIQEIVRNGADETVYLWSYNYQYPVAKITGTTFISVNQALHTFQNMNPAILADMSNPNMHIVNLLRTMPNTLVTTYTWKPLVGILTATDPRGAVTTCEYDTFGRLQTVRDHNGHAVENYDYHYKN